MSGQKRGGPTGAPPSSIERPKNEKSQTQQRHLKRPHEVLESDVEVIDEANTKKKMVWNAYPETRDFVDGSGVTSCAEKEEFLTMYTEACKIYKEGGADVLTKNNVKNRIQNLRHGKVKSRQSPSLGEESNEESGDLNKKSYGSNTPAPTPSPPSPKFRTLLPGEQIDFTSFQNSVTTLQDQCQRLMGSLEESRRVIEALTAERDHYKEFWQAMTNYHSVMARFQVPAPAIAVTAGPLPTQMAYTPIPQINVPPANT